MPVSRFEPPRIVCNATEGWGKTSLGAYAQDPAILMAGGETGYLTLLGGDRVPQVPAVGLTDWLDVLAMVDSLIDDSQGRQTIVLDALGGFERLCHEYVCKKEFKNDWSKTGFLNYHQGYHQSVGEWLNLLAKLDRLRSTQGMTVLILSHSIVRSFKNPMGPDYDRYIADCHEKTWGATHKWADAVFFGNFHTVVDVEKGRKSGKGVGGTDRVIYTERRDAFDAKNRYGMQESMMLPDNPGDAWTAIWNSIKGKK